MKKRYWMLILAAMASVLTGYAKPSETKVKEVIVVFKTHFDIGYTDWAANVKHNYAGSMVEGALHIIDQSKQMPPDQQFKWIVAGWPMKEMLANSKPAVPVNLRGEKVGEPIVIKNNQFEIKLSAYKPVSFVLGTNRWQPFAMGPIR